MDWCRSVDDYLFIIEHSRTPSGYLFILFNLISLILSLQLPVLSFRVDQLPMSETVMGIWGSLVRLAGTSGGAISSTALPATPFQPLSLTQSLPPSRSLLGPADQQDSKDCH